MPESADPVPPAPRADLTVPERRARHAVGLTRHRAIGPAPVTVVRNIAARPVRADTPGSAGSMFGSQGALLGVIPLGAGSRLAVIGYLLPAARADDLVRRDGPVRRDERHPEGLVVDAVQHRALVNGHDIGLVYREFELLAFLTARPCQAFTRAHLLDQVWGDAYQGSSRTVDVHIHRLRRKLGHEYGQRLVTMRHLGYTYQPVPGSQSSGFC